MQYQIKILLLSFVITIITSLAIIPILKKLKVGQMERTEGPQSHLGKQGTPTMGGIIMILVITVLTGFLCYDYIKDNQSSVAKNLIPIAAVSIGFGLVGFIDDFKKLVLKNTKGLKPSYKMIGLLIISVAYVIYLVYGLKLETDTYIPIWKNYIHIPVYIYSVCNIGYIRSNKCCKFNRWNRWISIKYMCNYNYHISNYWYLTKSI